MFVSGIETATYFTRPIHTNGVWRATPDILCWRVEVLDSNQGLQVSARLAATARLYESSFAAVRQVDRHAPLDAEIPHRAFRPIKERGHYAYASIAVAINEKLDGRHEASRTS